MDKIFGAEGVFADCLEQYEPRSGQIAMAQAVDNLLNDADDFESLTEFAKILVIEAETGIGKTLAYLVPALLSGKRIIVSTATLNLQDQIINKDIPLVQRALGKDIRILCMKGRDNYLCLYRWYQYRSNPQISLVDEPWVGSLDAWLETTVEGDRAELEWLGERNRMWHKIAARSSHCLGSDCPEGAHCFVNSMRKRAGTSQLIVVNHHLFFSDLALRRSGFGDLLPRYQAVIFDEAHHLENIATTFFGQGISQYQIYDAISDLERLGEHDLAPSQLDLLLVRLSGFKRLVERFFTLFPPEKGRFHLLPFLEECGHSLWRQEVEQMAAAFQEAIDAIAGYRAHGEGWLLAEKRLSELRARLLEISLGAVDGNDHECVYWYEKRDRAVLLTASPIEVASHLRESLYQQVEACVLTSATLTAGGSFSYIQKHLGLDGVSECLRFASPFNYREKALIYIPEDGFPPPNSASFSRASGERILQLLSFSRGRGLVLCTSFAGMYGLLEYLRDRLDYPILVQGEGARTPLLQRFREETNSVLLAVASFWEGVDIVGESLSCLIIDKLPFEVPSDPVVQARIARVKEEGGNPFFDFQVPRASLTLRQGVGRLMRSVSDQGVIAIMDIRLFSKGYGMRFQRSLPPSPVTRAVEDVAAFFARLDYGKDVQAMNL